MSKCKFIFARYFCLLHWSCGASCTQFALVRSWRGIWKKKKEKEGHTECYSNQGSRKPWDPFGLSVCTLQHRRAHVIYTSGYIAQTNSSAHAPQPRKQHMHKTGSGATTEGCCFNGSDLLLLRPMWKSWAAASSHWMNPVPWQLVTWSSGLWATACLPACSAVSWAFNHSSPRIPPSLIQCKSVSCSKDATQWARHLDTKDGSLCLWQEDKNRADITALLPISQINRHKSVYALLLCYCTRQQVSSHIVHIKTQRSTQTYKDD